MGRLNSLLEKIAWKTRRFHLKYQSLVVYLNDHDTWGFSIMTFTYRHRDYSLLSFHFRLPNKTSVKVLSLDRWDVLFLRNYLWNIYDELSDAEMWSANLSTSDKLKLELLSRLFR
jgi:hypothetical protein